MIFLFFLIQRSNDTQIHIHIYIYFFLENVKKTFIFKIHFLFFWRNFFEKKKRNVFSITFPNNMNFKFFPLLVTVVRLDFTWNRITESSLLICATFDIEYLTVMIHFFSRVMYNGKCTHSIKKNLKSCDAILGDYNKVLSIF